MPDFLPLFLVGVATRVASGVSTAGGEVRAALRERRLVVDRDILLLAFAEAVERHSHLHDAELRMLFHGYAGRPRAVGPQATPYGRNLTVANCTLRQMNLSKLVAEDTPLFLSLLDDLFPGVKADKQTHAEVGPACNQAITDLGYQLHPTWVNKVIQVYEMCLVRHSLMLVGPSGTGKTKILEVLMGALSACKPSAELPPLVGHSFGASNAPRQRRMTCRFTHSPNARAAAFSGGGVEVSAGQGRAPVGNQVA